MVSSKGSIGEDAPRRAIHLTKYSNIADAFNRMRVSTPVGLFDGQMQYNLGEIFWNKTLSTTSASAIHLPNESSVRLRVTGDESVVRQSKNYHRYQPGKSQLVLTTFGGFESDIGVDKRVGYYDDENGIFAQSDAAGYYLVKRSFVSGSVVDTKIAQSVWNIDTFNGAGPSKVALDFSKVQILIIDLEWLGVGRVRTGFVIDGVIHYAHEFVHANTSTTTYMTTANLPIRYEIAGSTSATGNNDLVQICCAVISEGGFETPTGVPFATSNDTTPVSATTDAEDVILAIRPTTTFNSITNRIQIIPQTINVFAGDESIHYHIIYGADVLGGAWGAVGGGNSAMQVNKTSTGFAGGFDIHEGYIAAATIGSNITSGGGASKISQRLPLALDIDGSHPTTGFRDTILVAATGVSAAAATFAVIEWLELR